MDRRMNRRLMAGLVGGAALAILAACAPDAPPLSGRTVASRCLDTALPVETAITIFGAYRGEPAPDAPPAGFREHPPARIAVETGDGRGPEVLVLSSYEPVTWDVSAVAANDLRGVVAYGYYAGEVVGVPDDVPVRIVALRVPGEGDGRGRDLFVREASADDAADGKAGRLDLARHCGDPAWVYRIGPPLDRLSKDVETSNGLPVAAFVGTYSAASLSLANPPPPSRVETGRIADCEGPARECMEYYQREAQRLRERSFRTKWRDDPWGRGDGG